MLYTKNKQLYTKHTSLDLKEPLMFLKNGQFYFPIKNYLSLVKFNDSLAK